MLILLMILTVAGEVFGATFTTTPNNLTFALVGGSVSLKWVYSHTTRMTFVKWYKVNEKNEALSTIMMLVDGLPPNIPPEYVGRVTYDNDASMTLKNLKLSDEGWFVCIVDFLQGATIYSKIELQIARNPHSTNVPLQSTVLAANNISITCTSTAKPEANILWFGKDNKELSDGTDYSIVQTNLGKFGAEIRSQSVLRIKNAKTTQAGIYKCLSKNAVGSDEAETTLTVYYKPSDTALQFKFSTRLEGESNTLVCGSQALPLPIYYAIFRGNTLISNKTLGKIEMSLVKNYDEGIYKCVPSNWVGQGAEKTSKLTVNVRPTLYDSEVSSVIVIEGESVNIICKYFADPSPIITWRKYNAGNNKNLNIDTLIILQNSTLTKIGSTVKFLKTNRDDYGIYSCSATNDFGTANKNISLLVYYIPFMTLYTLRKPKFYVNESSMETETCIAQGFPQPTIKWYRDNVEIKDGRHSVKTSIVSMGSNFVKVKSVIILNDLIKDDAGKFKCEATNEAGSVKEETSLNVYYEPEITAQMSKKTYVNLGKSLSFSCVARGIDQPVFKWYRDKVEIISGVDNVLITHSLANHPFSSSFLTINPVTRASSNAEYKCVASNRLGNDTRKTLVSVYFGPTIVSFPSPSIVTNENRENYQISCIVQANPKPSIVWLKEGRPISVNTINSNYELDEVVVTASASITVMNSTLTIKKVERNDFGNWTCRGINTLVGGTVTQAQDTLQLTVTYAPRFEFMTSNPFRNNQTDTVIFICRVKASPKPFVWWELPATVTKDNRFRYKTTAVTDKTEFGSVEARLTITNVGKGDFGDYVCQTNNTITSDSRTTKLIVQYNPTATSDFSEGKYEVTEKSLLHIEVVVDANPSAVIEWYKSNNGSNYKKIIKNIETIQVAVIRDYENKYKSRLKFPEGLTRRDQAYYSVRIRNSLGKVEKKTYLIVFWKPEYATKLSKIEDTLLGQSPSFICRFYSNPKSTIQWLKNGVLITDKAYSSSVLMSNSSITLIQSTLTFLNVQVSDKANYTCIAKNIIGESSQHKYLNVLYAPILKVASSNLMIDIAQPLVLSCDADANPPIFKYIWKKDRQRINNNKNTYTIKYGQRSTRGNYSCTPVNSQGNTSTVTYSVTVRVPPTFTQPASCVKHEPVTSGKTAFFTCVCSGTGYPTPDVYWTKYPSSTHLSNDGALNFTAVGSKQGTYYCYLKNSKSQIRTSVQITILASSVLGPWTGWGACNTTCGTGIQHRTRVCNVLPCGEKLKEVQTCVGSCAGKKVGGSNDEVNWLYALYALIPCAILLIILGALWIARLNRGNVGQQS